MAEISKDTVKYIGGLSRIELDESEIKDFSVQLEKIIEYVEKINELDLNEVPPTFNPHPESNVYRDDEITEFSDNKALVDIFPAKDGNFIKIPKVID